MYEKIDHNLMFKSLLPNEVRVIIVFDDIGLRSNLTTNKTIKFTKKSFFQKFSGFTQSHSGLLNNLTQGFVWETPGSTKNAKPNKYTGIDKIALKCDSVNASSVKGMQEPVLYGFAFDKPQVKKFLWNQKKFSKKNIWICFTFYNVFFFMKWRLQTSWF